MQSWRLVRSSLFVAATTAVIAWACGGGSSGSGSGSPTQPTPRPAAFTFAVQILGVTPVAAPAGFNTDYRGPVQKKVQARVTVTETGGTYGGVIDELLFEFLTKGNAKVYPFHYSANDIIHAKQTNKVPAGGSFTFDTTLLYTNTSGDIVNTLRASGIVNGDDSTKTTPAANTGVAAPTPCTPSSTALCLQNGRYQVTTTWHNGTQGGTGTAVKDTDEVGNFWFFNPNNVEMTVKVLNGCSTNQRYWVFAGSTTNIEYKVTVTDTATGAVKSYMNPLGQSMPAATDMEAFATCP
jgi:hypothetical protein